jgi:multiple sugar transport system substrate-binding protein
MNDIVSSGHGATRRAILSAATLAGLGAPSAAQAQGAAAPNPRLSGELSIGIFASLEPNMRAIVTNYERVRPNVRVTLNVLTSNSEEMRSLLLARRVANRLPAITGTLDRFPRMFADAGLTIDHTEFLSRGPVTYDLFSPPHIGQYRVLGGRHNGQIHGLPTGADVVVLYYNMDHFDAAGIPYPNRDWTWETLVDAARRLTVRQGSNVVRYGFGGRYHWHATYVPRIRAYGGEFFADGRVNLRSEAATKAFASYIDYVREGIFAHPETIRAAGGEAQGFAAEVYSMSPLVRFNLALIRQTRRPGMRFDVELQPSVNGRRAVGMGSVGISLTPEALRVKELAYDFLTYFYDENGGMRVLCSTYATTPPISSLFNSPIWRALPDQPRNLDVYIDAMRDGVPNPPGIPADAQGVIDESVLNAVQAMIIGGRDISAALAEADTRINRRIEQVGGG